MIKFSFIVPAYNEEKYIVACLTSIVSTESFGDDCEVIVVDNASTDRTAALIRENFPVVKIVYEATQGLTWARQAGFLASQGEYVCSIDADNILPEYWLIRARAIIQEIPQYVAFSGPYRIETMNNFIRHGYEKFSSLTNVLFGFMRIGASLIGGNMVIRRDALVKIGGFDTSVEFWGEDALTAKRLIKIGKIRFYPDFFVFSSPRRMQQAGAFKAGSLYIFNYMCVVFLNRPLVHKYKNFR